MIVGEQTIWLAPRATAFTALCDACLSDERALDDYLAASVSGTLRLDACRGSAVCRRGHQIRVERVERSLAGVIR